jgi:heme/copper-type cytochrome/quinol oxidase subunit 2
MKVYLICIIAVMIVLNIISFSYGKSKMKKIEVNEQNSEELYKKGIKYVAISVVLSFLTIIGVTVVAVLNYLGNR